VSQPLIPCASSMSTMCSTLTNILTRTQLPRRPLLLRRPLKSAPKARPCHASHTSRCRHNRYGIRLHPPVYLELTDGSFSLSIGDRHRGHRQPPIQPHSVRRNASTSAVLCGLHQRRFTLTTPRYELVCEGSAQRRKGRWRRLRSW
jgi:hypothetical protein